MYRTAENRLGAQPVPRMEIKLTNPVADPDWDRLVTSHPDATFFHSAAWAEVLSQTYSHEPLYLRCFQGDRLVALFPIMEVRSLLTGRRGVCLPFTDCCNPLLFDEEASTFTLEALFEVARDRKWKHLEVRGRTKLDIGSEPAEAFYDHTVDLRSTPSELLARFKSPARRALRKANRSGLQVEVTGSPEAIKEYYRLHAQTRKRHGVPPQPLSFFQNIQEAVISRGLGFVVLARFGGQPVAGAVFFRFGNKALYKFAASDLKFQNLRPNNLVIWQGARYLAENGVEELDLGRTALNHHGLRRFKLSCGSTEKTIHYFKFETAVGHPVRDDERPSAFQRAIFGRLPVALNCLAGSLIYPHLD
jgi:CelD/BcsL family acetyltransferase involved in cellulose biosynthesis